MSKGYVHVLTGDGKGKTTAAIGLTIRAAGSGLKIFFAQFVKKGEYSEIKAFRRLSDQITVEQFGLGRFARMNPKPEDILAAQNGLNRVRTIMTKNKYDMMVLDEITVAVRFGLIAANDLLGLIINKPHSMELIITGRYASPRVIENADMVTQMKARKHYYQSGVKARVGIEK
jgi:cob(I)alamin adenosyltransferase